MDWRELQLKNSLKQAGSEVDPIEPEKTPSWLEGWDPDAPNAQEDYDNRFLNSVISGSSFPELLSSSRQGQGYRAMTYPDYNKIASELGYGTAEGDTDIPISDWLNNPVDYRAASQSPGEKILNGAAKMLALTGTTFLDNTAGLVAGIMNVGADAVGDIPGVSEALGVDNEKLTWRGAVDDFINNPFSEWMQQIRDWSEQALPNYRTQEEMDEQDQWWKHMNADFWGDTVLKNLGFTIGAGLSGAVFAKGFNALTRGKVADKAYKAALAASNGDADAAQAFRSVMQGGGAPTAKKMFDVFEDVQNSFRKLDLTSQIIGGVGGALGEARMEAMMSAKEFRDKEMQDNQARYENDYNKLIDYISKNKDFFDENGEVNQDGINYFNNKVAELQLNYATASSEIDNQARSIANSVFGLNSFVLSLSNMVMFGKLFSGGYKSQAKNLVRGSFGNYKPKGSVFKGVTRGVLNAGTEGLEELTQKIISEGNKRIAMDNMASFHNKKYDKDALQETTNTLFDFLDSTGNVLIDPTSWEEFAVGFFTGALGSPSHFGFSNWSGGLLGGIQGGINERNQSRNLAQSLNEQIKSEQFRDLFSGLVRHKTLENLQMDDIASGNKFAWHTHKDEQLLNDVIMFADAGRLDDLEAYVDSLANVSDEELKRIKPLLQDDTDPNFSQRGNEYLKGWLSDRAKDVKKTINQYRNFYNTIDFLSFGTTDKEAIKELVFTEAQLDNFERRYNDILDGVLKKVRPELEEISRETTQTGAKSERAIRAERLLASEENLRRLFGGVALDIKARAQDSENGENFFRMIDADKQAAVLKDLADLGVFAKDNVTKQEVADLQALVIARADFYAKLFDPKGRKKFRDGFQEAAITDTEAAQDSMTDTRKKFVADAVSKVTAARNFGDFLDIYRALPEFDEESFKQFTNEAGKDQSTKNRMDKVQDMMSFWSNLENAIADKAKNVSPENVGAVQTLLDAFHNIDDEKLFKGADDDVDVERVIGKALLDSVANSPEAEQFARGILTELLRDKAQIYGFGTIPGSGSGGGQQSPGAGGGQGGGQGGYGGGTKTKDEVRKEIEDKIASELDRNGILLNKIAAGDFSDYPADMFTPQEKAEMVAVAMAKLTELKKKAGEEGGSDDVPPRVDDDRDPIAVAKAREQFVAMDTRSISGSRPPIYDPEFLKKGIVKVYDGGEPGTQATIRWMMNHNVQDFIDTGALAKLSAAHKGNLPIYFLANPHYVENNIDNNPFIVKNNGATNKKYPHIINVLMAVEMNAENREILKDYINAGVINDSTLITVGSGNNATQYQAIGEMWSPTPKYVESQGANTAAYQNVREQAQLIWEHAVGRSILPHYQHDVEQAKRAGKSIPDEGRWYVARIHPTAAMQESDVASADFNTGERMSTTLNYIMSGRNEVKKLGDAEYTKKPLANTLQEYKAYGGKYYFKLFVRNREKQPFAQTAGAPEFPSSISAPLGSLWMATTEANGAWAWNYISIAKANEFDFNANANTKLVKRINSAIDAILAPSTGQYDNADFQRRIEGIRMLKDIFYIGEGNNVVLDFTSGPAVVIGGAYCRSKEDVYQALSIGKYRFQVNVEAMNNKASMDELIDAGVLSSEMESFIRAGASIGVNFMTDKDADGNEIPVQAVKSAGDIARTAGSRVVFTSGSYDGMVANVRIGEAGYALDTQTGKVYRMASKLRRGEEVVDDLVVAEVKGIAELMSLRGQNTPYPGKKWIISDKFQYTELFERVINGKIVHMKKEGKNPDADYELVFSDEVWNNYMEAGIAKPAGPQFSRPEPKPEPETPDADMYKAYGRQAAAEEGGKQIDEPPRGGGRKRGIGRGINSRRVDITQGSKTLQDAAKDNVKDNSKNNCD